MNVMMGVTTRDVLFMSTSMPTTTVGWDSSSTGVGIDGSTWGEGISSKLTNFVACVGSCVCCGALWWLRDFLPA
jgi:hypothetical protein